MSEMVERVAKALWRQDPETRSNWDPNTEWDRVWATVMTPESGRAIWLNRARIAIQAMREPTEEMLAAGKKEVAFVSSTADVYRSMIAAAFTDTRAEPSE